MDLVKSWQEAALETEGYTGTPIYPVILSIIVNSERQVINSRTHVSSSNTGDSLHIGSFSRSSKELHLNGNQPLLKETRMKDEVERGYSSSDVVYCVSLTLHLHTYRYVYRTSKLY